MMVTYPCPTRRQGNGNLSMRYLSFLVIMVGYLTITGSVASSLGMLSQNQCQRLLQPIDPANPTALNPAVAIDELLVVCEQAFAAEPDDPEHQYGYARALMLIQDHSTALQTLNRAADQGHSGARFQLGLAQLHGRGGIPADPSTAVVWLRRAAEQDYAPAAYQLAEEYAIGATLPRDPESAAYWLQQAASQHYPPAQYALGLAYRDGRGVKQSHQHALRWLTRSARQNWPAAQYVLAMEYFHGAIVSPDFSQALAWLQRAADNGYTAAERGFFADEICELTQP